MKVAVYTIAKNESRQVPSYLDCCRDAGLRENRINLAQFYYEIGDWSGGYHACEKALAIGARPAAA